MPAKPPALRNLLHVEERIDSLAKSGKTVPNELRHQAQVLSIGVAAQKGNKAKPADVAGVRPVGSRLGGG